MLRVRASSIRHPASLIATRVSVCAGSSQFFTPYSTAASSGRLFVVGTPIGNYEDMGMRAGTCVRRQISLTSGFILLLS